MSMYLCQLIIDACFYVGVYTTIKHGICASREKNKTEDMPEHTAADILASVTNLKQWRNIKST